LQTTLCLAWREGEVIYLAFVGDGRAAIQRGAGEDQRIDIVGDLDEETNRVHALGPCNRHVQEPDVFDQFVAEGSTRLALFTDGVGRGLHPATQSVFDEVDEFKNKEANVAERMIERWISLRSADFEDNLSLAIVTEA